MNNKSENQSLTWLNFFSIDKEKFEEFLAIILIGSKKHVYDELWYFSRQIVLRGLRGNFRHYHALIYRHNFTTFKDFEDERVAEIVFRSSFKSIDEIRSLYPLLNEFALWISSQDKHFLIDRYELDPETFKSAAPARSLIQIADDTILNLKPHEHHFFQSFYVGKKHNLKLKKIIPNRTDSELDGSDADFDFKKIQVDPLNEFFLLSQRLAILRAVLLLDVYFIFNNSDMSNIEKLGLISELSLLCSSSISSQGSKIKELRKEYDKQSHISERQSFTGRQSETKNDQELVNEGIDKALRNGIKLDNVTASLLHRHYVGNKESGNKPTVKTIKKYLDNYKKTESR